MSPGRAAAESSPQAVVVGAPRSIRTQGCAHHHNVSPSLLMASFNPVACLILQISHRGTESSLPCTRAPASRAPMADDEVGVLAGDETQSRSSTGVVEASLRRWSGTALLGGQRASAVATKEGCFACLQQCLYRAGAPRCSASVLAAASPPFRPEGVSGLRC